jgi:hypothetical protein
MPTLPNRLYVVFESSLLSANQIVRIEEAIEKFMLLAKEAKKTRDEIPMAIMTR